MNSWVNCSYASAKTGESLRNWQIKARNEVKLANIQKRQPLAYKGPSPSGGKQIWYIHRKFDPQLTNYPDKPHRDERNRSSLSARYPEHQVTAAFRKAHWLRQWRTACDARQNQNVTELDIANRIIFEAKAADGDSFSISFRTLQIWHKAYQTINSDGEINGVESLIDGRAKPSQGGGDGSGGIPPGRSKEAVAYFYALYHTESCHGIRVCHEHTVMESTLKGWSWPPTYAATHKWLAVHDNRSMSCLLRDGKDVWCRKYMPHNDIDYSLIDPGQFYQTDHHQCDFWVEYDGKQIRPWLTAVQDSRSRMIVGWHLGPSPHQDAIIAAYLMAFKNYAIPEKIRIDNGKDFASELLCGETKAARDRLRRIHGPNYRQVMRDSDNLVDCYDPRFQGIVAELGVELIYAIPYAPWSKGITERWFGTFAGRCSKTFVTYCGRNALKKPECLETIRRGYTKEQKRRYKKQYGREWIKVAILRTVDQSDIPTMDQAREAIGEYIEIYHNTTHGAEDMDGRTPLEMWQTAERLQRAGEDELLFLMRTRGVYRVTANGVAFKVGSLTLKYGGGNPALYRWTGRDVLIAIDPNDLSCCHAFTADQNNRRYIGRLDANERISPMATVDNLHEANAAVGHSRKDMHKASRQSANRTRAAVVEMNTKRRQKIAELRATGTTGNDHHPTIVPVVTGYESAVESIKAPSTPPRDRKTRDLKLAAQALAGDRKITGRKKRKRVSDDLFQPIHKLVSDSHQDECGNEKGKDADQKKSINLLNLIASKDRQDGNTQD